MLTYILFKTQSMLLSETSRKGHQMLTYSLFKTQKMFLSETSRNAHPDADLHPVIQSMLLSAIRRKGQTDATYILFKTRACSYQKQTGRASQMLTYKLFKNQSMPLSETSGQSLPDADLQTVQNPQHAIVSNKQDGPARH